MLESITIKDVATYDSIGVTINNLRKINFIYGTNGCGKTTLSKLIYAPTESAYLNCSLGWRGNIPVNVLVYNKDFRDRNFGKGKIDGVFTLGQATKDEIEAIQKMQLELAEIKNKGIEKKNTLEKQETNKLDDDNQFKEAIWKDIYKENELEFKEAFKGFMKKESFREKILNEYNDNVEALLTYQELKDRALTIFGNTLHKPNAIDPFRRFKIDHHFYWFTNN